MLAFHAFLLNISASGTPRKVEKILPICQTKAIEGAQTPTVVQLRKARSPEA